MYHLVTTRETTVSLSKLAGIKALSWDEWYWWVVSNEIDLTESTASDAVRSILIETTHQYQSGIVIKIFAVISVNYGGSVHFCLLTLDYLLLLHCCV